MAEHDVEQVWQSFWEPIVTRHGVAGPDIDLDQIKRELYDYHRAQTEVPLIDRIASLSERIVVSRERAYDEGYNEGYGDAEYDASEDSWQRGYEQGFEEGRDRGFDEGLDEARSRI